MSTSWKTLSARIDALSLRERVFLFLSVIAVCMALADTLWLAPARAAHQVARQKFATENIELQRLRDEVRARASQDDPAKAIRDDIARVKAGIDTTNQAIVALSGASRGAITLPEVLVHFLRRQGGLALLHTSSLAPAAQASGGSQVNRPNAVAPVGVVRQGLELTVAGPYPDLVRYVQTLENSMPDLRWGTMKLAAEQQAPQLSLQVFLVAPQP